LEKVFYLIFKHKTMEAIIRYNDKKDFEEITAFGKERGFTVTKNDEKRWEREHGDFKCTYVNGMPMIRFQPDIATEGGEENLTIKDVAGAFTDIGIDVDELRRSIQRNRA